jgi:hypothetical protein
MLQLAGGVVIALVMVGSAAAGAPECELYDQAYENAALFKVQAGEREQRVYFYSRPDSCNDAKPCTSRRKTYLVTGDVVFGGPEESGFRCAYYGSAKGNLIAGFLPAKNLRPFAGEDELSAGFLAGDWQMRLGPKLAPNTITIKAAGPGKVSATGSAYYQTAETVNEGSFESDGVTVAKGAKQLLFRDHSGADCEVTVHRRGPYLVVADNGNCGGLNVSFQGIYVRFQPRVSS